MFGTNLKWFHGCIHTHQPDLERPGRFNDVQKHCTVVAKSRKRALEIIKHFDSMMTLGYLTHHFSMMDQPGLKMQGKPVEEGLWIESWQTGEFIRVWPEEQGS